MEGLGKYKKIWSATHQKLKTTMYNYLSKLQGSPVSDNFIDEKKRNFGKIIEANPKWGASNRMAFYFMISRYLDLKNPKDKYVKLYAQKGYDYEQQIAKQTGANKLEGKEIENWKQYDYFHNILKNTPKTDKDTLKTNYERLLLSLIILHPPVRTSYYRTAKFIRSIKDNDKKNNFIHINLQGKKSVTLIINDDKASNYKVYKSNPKLSLIKIESPELVETIIDSFNRYPRQYLFENLKTKQPFNDNSLLKILRKITKIPAINFQMMRSIYITWHHSKYPSYEAKRILSLKMRHSVDTAAKNYYKDLDEKNEKEEKDDEPKEVQINTELKKEKDELKKVNDELKKQLDEVKAHCKDAFKPNDKLYIKRRKDILYRYNQKGVAPTTKTMNKYTIKYNDATKLYE